jgi:hypothetical protein
MNQRHRLGKERRGTGGEEAAVSVVASSCTVGGASMRLRELTLVGVELERKLSMRLFELVLRGGPLHAQDLVVPATARRHRVIMEPSETQSQLPWPPHSCCTPCARLLPAVVRLGPPRAHSRHAFPAHAGEATSEESTCQGSRRDGCEGAASDAARRRAMNILI